MMSYFNTSTDSLGKGCNIDLEPAFVFEPKQKHDETLQETAEPNQNADELRHEQPDVGNPVTLTFMDEPLLTEPEVYNSVCHPVEEESNQVDSRY